MSEYFKTVRGLCDSLYVSLLYKYGLEYNHKYFPKIIQEINAGLPRKIKKILKSIIYSNYSSIAVMSNHSHNGTEPICNYETDILLCKESHNNLIYDHVIQYDMTVDEAISIINTGYLYLNQLEDEYKCYPSKTILQIKYPPGYEFLAERLKGLNLKILIEKIKNKEDDKKYVLNITPKIYGCIRNDLYKLLGYLK